MAKLDLVYNPVSGSFREARLAALVEAFQGQGFAVNPLPTRADGAQLSGGADLVCVHGGDGTLRDVLTAMGDAAGAIPLAIARAGTINLVARELDYPAKETAMAQRIKAAFEAGPDRWLHSPLFQLGGLPIASCLSIGPDSHAVARVSGDLKRKIGRFAYVAAMLQQMRDWPRDPMQVSGELADGSEFTCEAEALFVARGSFYAGPFRLSPRAALHTETIELITINRASRSRMAAFSTAAALRLPLDRFGFAEIRSVRRLEIADCAAPAQVDGDVILQGNVEPNLSIEPANLTLRYVA